MSKKNRINDSADGRSEEKNNPVPSERELKKKKKAASPKKGKKEKQPNTLKKVIIVGALLVVFFAALALLSAFNVIRFPVLKNGSVTLKLSDGNGSPAAQPADTGIEKPDFLDPDGMSDEEIREEVDELLAPVDADEYFEEIGTVKEKTYAISSDDVTDEDDTLSLMEDRGFADWPILTEYDMYGDYSSAVEISGGYEEHPVYRMVYIDGSDRQWVVFIVNGSVYAMLLDYTAENPDKPLLYVAETDSLTGYDSRSNTFYEYVPNADLATVVKLDKITAEALDSFEY